MKKRLQKAKILLKFSKKNINEIANECAFSSVAWFIERFKEKYEQTPKQYQKNKKTCIFYQKTSTFFFI